MSRVNFIRVRAILAAHWIRTMADTKPLRRFRAYFEEQSRTEIITYAASAEEAKAYTDKLFRKGKSLPDKIRVRTDTSDWMVEDLGK